MVTAGSLGLFHTLLGPDHYVPFIVMSKARQWKLRRTMFITFVSGLGHVLSSIVLGTVGIAFGIAVANLEGIEASRGEVASWMLIAFGMMYLAWGIKQAFRKEEHVHEHAHEDGTVHNHNHRHRRGHLHPHVDASKKNITPWVLFTIFLFGPCEPLIPLLMYPAAQESAFGVFMVAFIFGAVTISTMMSIVYVASKGITIAPLKRLDRYVHALSGGAITACGFAMVFLGI